RSAERAEPLAAIAVLWLLGALLLAFLPEGPVPTMPPLRIAMVGLVYALVFARAVLAIRVSAAPPAVTDATSTVIALLVVLPASILLIEHWGSIWPSLPSGAAATGRGYVRFWRNPRARRQAMRLGILLATGPALVFAASRGNLQLALLAATVVGVITFGVMT